MHEASIVLSIIDTLTRQCEREGYSRINSIRLRIGKAAHLVPDSLEFAFEVIKKNTLAEHAELIIEIIPVTARCSACGDEFEIRERFSFNCPACASAAFTIIKGYEMEIVDMEVD
jgi:hydrogenase nickel incorporation protein HypA/HybF